MNQRQGVCATLVTKAGAVLVTRAGAELVTKAGAELVTKAGAELVTRAGAELVTRASAELVTKSECQCNVQTATQGSRGRAIDTRCTGCTGLRLNTGQQQLYTVHGITAEYGTATVVYGARDCGLTRDSNRCIRCTGLRLNTGPRYNARQQPTVCGTTVEYGRENAYLQDNTPPKQYIVRQTKNK